MKSKQDAPRKFVPSMQFTLIECLVVMAIIALLMSILLPSLSRAKRAVNKIVCFNSLKQLNCAENMYLNDFNGYFQMTYLQTATSGSVRFWDQLLVDQKYLDNYNPFKCPERQKFRSATEVNPSDYVTNLYVFKPLLVIGVLNFLNISQVNYPSETLELLDMQTDPLGRGLGSSGINSRIGYVHLGGINTVFVDGHTQWFCFGNLSNSSYTLEED